MSGIRRVSDLGTQGVKTILDGSVQTADIANNAVTQAKLSTDVPLSGMRNVLINGSFDVWQRMASTTLTFTPTVNVPTYNMADRWFVGNNPTAVSTNGLTVSQVTADNSQFLYGIQVGRTAGQTATGQVFWGQAIETLNSRRLAGQTVTLSFWAKRNTAVGTTSPSTIQAVVYTGTGTDQSTATWMSVGWTGQITALNQSTALTGTMTRYSYSFSLNSNTKQIVLHFYYTPSGTAASEWVQMEGVQLESGSQATPFEQRPIGVELQLCQRYYFRYSMITSGGYHRIPSLMQTYSANAAQGIMFHPVPLRLPNGGHTLEANNVSITDNATFDSGYGTTTINTSNSSAYTSFIAITSIAGTVTQGSGRTLELSNASSYIGVSAEL